MRMNRLFRMCLKVHYDEFIMWYYAMHFIFNKENAWEHPNTTIQTPFWAWKFIAHYSIDPRSAGWAANFERAINNDLVRFGPQRDYGRKGWFNKKIDLNRLKLTYISSRTKLIMCKKWERPPQNNEILIACGGKDKYLIPWNVLVKSI